MKWLKRLGWFLAFPALLVLFVLLWGGFKYLTYSQSDNAVHLAAKQDYLESLRSIAATPSEQQRPNIIVIFYDDLGYGDLGATGSQSIKTPHIDQLAANGVMLNNFYAAAPVCSPSRAALLSGRIPARAGLPQVVFPTGSWKSLINIIPGQNVRIPAEEILLPDMLKAAGYRTGMVGKWHIGDRAPSLPNNFNFDSYYGALYSNDMEPFALYRDGKVEVEAPADQTKLDDLYTTEAVRFIAAQGDGEEPFFLYFAHNFPHIPLFTSPAMAGKSAAGLYGDVVESLDQGVGRLVAALKVNNQFENTIIIITSDNGPWYEGSPGNARGRKGMTFEGGMHEPFIIHWPAGLAGGRKLDGMAMATGLLPTFADWLSLPLPKDRTIDGKSLRRLLEGEGEQVHDYLYYFAANDLMAVRDARFKYHDRQPIHYVLSGNSLSLPTQHGPWLFDLQNDPDESYDVSGKYPEVAKRLRQAMLAKRTEMEANKRGWQD